MALPIPSLISDYPACSQGRADIPLNSTFVIINGVGAAFARTDENFIEGVDGDIFIKYTTLGPAGKAVSYTSRNTVIDDYMWSSGEKLILNGRDGNNIGEGSSVLVSVNSMSDTLNDYSLKPGSTVIVKVIDATTQRLISESISTAQSVN